MTKRVCCLTTVVPNVPEHFRNENRTREVSGPRVEACVAGDQVIGEGGELEHELLRVGEGVEG